MAANANDTYAALYYAQDEGYFTRGGLNVDLQTMGNGAEGKVVAINALGVGLDLSLHAWITTAGGDWSKIKLIEVPFSEMGVALDHGTADAAVMAEPGYTVALKQFNVQTVVALDSVVGAPYLISSRFTRDWAAKHPEDIARFTRAIYATEKWANTHHPETAVILAKYSKLDINIVRPSSPRT